MPTPGIRIKSTIIKNTPIETIAELYRNAGFDVCPGSKLSARAAVIAINVAFHDGAGKECCRYPASVKVMDGSITIRWAAISSRQYYHIAAYHQDELDALNDRAYKVWADYATAYWEQREKQEAEV